MQKVFSKLRKLAKLSNAADPICILTMGFVGCYDFFKNVEKDVK